MCAQFDCENFMGNAMLTGGKSSRKIALHEPHFLLDVALHSDVFELKSSSAICYLPAVCVYFTPLI